MAILIDLSLGREFSSFGLPLGSGKLLLASFTGEAVNDDFSFNAKLMREMQAGEHQEQYRHFIWGFRFFVLAHEYMHCFHGHLSELSPNFAGVRRLRPAKHLEWGLSELASLSLAPPGEQQIDRFMHLHELEFRAGLNAMMHLLEYISLVPGLPASNAFCMILGALSFLWYVRVTEQVHGAVSEGESWFDNPIRSLHFAQSLLSRFSHPTPAERLLNLRTYIATEHKDDATKKLYCLADQWLDGFITDLLDRERQFLLDCISPLPANSSHILR